MFIYVHFPGIGGVFIFPFFVSLSYFSYKESNEVKGHHKGLGALMCLPREKQPFIPTLRKLMGC